VTNNTLTPTPLPEGGALGSLSLGERVAHAVRRVRAFAYTGSGLSAFTSVNTTPLRIEATPGRRISVSVTKRA
jgi:hypothetical protein